MRNSLTELCESFIQNRNVIRSAFRFENIYIYSVCAALFTDKHKIADVQKLRECHDLLKNATGAFSSFRGISRLATISMLAISPNPEQRLKDALSLYSHFKTHFFTSAYLPAASMILSDMIKPERFQEVALRTRRIYDLMKNDHPLLTSSEDSIFASLLALSDLSDEQIVSENESCYKLLKQKFFLGNAVQSLSHVLSLGDGSAQDKCTRVFDLYDILKRQGYSYGKSSELATLGALALLPGSLRSIADDMAAVDDWLAKQKGYSIFSVGKKQRLMHSGMIVTSDLVGENTSAALGSAAIGATVSLIAAQQAMLLAAVAASSSAASSQS